MILQSSTTHVDKIAIEDPCEILAAKKALEAIRYPGANYTKVIYLLMTLRQHSECRYKLTQNQFGTQDNRMSLFGIPVRFTRRNTKKIWLIAKHASTFQQQFARP